MILNQNVPVVKMIPLIEAAEGRGAGYHGDPPPPSWTNSLIVLKKLLVQFRFFFSNERYCLQLKIIVIFRRSSGLFRYI